MIDILDDRMLESKEELERQMSIHYLINEEQEGMKISEAFKQSLDKITQFAKISVIEGDNLGAVKNLEEYSAIILGYNNFSETKDLPTDLEVPIVLAKSYGAVGVSFCHLGSSYSFTETLKIDNKDMTKTTIYNDSKPIQDWMEHWLSFDKFTPKLLSRVRVKKKAKEDFIVALLITFISESQGIDLSDAKSQVIDTFEKNNKGALLEETSDLEKYLGDIKESYITPEFHPVQSVLGGHLAQEILKIVTKMGRPFYGLYLYNAVEQQGRSFPPTYLHNLV
ncbi:unnamed protein product [Moneuplotes crassus]|uniref:Uncharacterized protein n=1 Tax=Euplotes crassus TaxID=5936 RepID=A0AAD1XH68_EUPCR|nr:unnamed protein product [Moneuplotes crassus]